MPTQEEINQTYLDAIATARSDWEAEIITHAEYHTAVKSAHDVCVADMWTYGYTKPLVTILMIDAEEIAADGVATATLSVHATPPSKDIDFNVYFLSSPEDNAILELSTDENGKASATIGTFSEGVVGTLHIEPGDNTWGDLYVEVGVVDA